MSDVEYSPPLASAAAAALGNWQDWREHFGFLSTAAGAGTYVLWPTGQGPGTSATAGYAAFYIDPAESVIAGKTAQFRTRMTVLCNDTAPAANFAGELRPATAPAGAAGGTISVTLGAAVVGATVATPAANSLNHAESAATALPAAGFYVCAVTVSAITAVNSTEAVHVALQRRWV